MLKGIPLLERTISMLDVRGKSGRRKAKKHNGEDA